MHLVNRAPHAQLLPDEFVDRFAIVGDAAECTNRLGELTGLGLDHLVITGPSFGADRGDAQRHHEAVTKEVLPALR
jgi:hypothetical protein